MAEHPAPTPRRNVGCTLGFTFLQPSVLAVQVAVPRRWCESERFVASIGPEPGGPTLPVRETDGAHGTRVHIIEAAEGPMTVSYTATAAAPPQPIPWPPPIDTCADEVLSALRQSRYCPTDVMAAFARAELPDTADPVELASAAASWVFERIAYAPGWGTPGDTAIDTLLAGRGVCRDFAHLTMALCRSCGVPARLVSAYAPGLTPMDFHVVVQVWIGDHWAVLDPTRLAPRGSLVPIATGRDAADTALSATIRGDVELVTAEVVAVLDGDLPADDHERPTVLP